MRKLASLQIIDSLSPIKGADRIEIAQVLGWQVVVKKDEFKVGDKVIYLEVDSVLPDKKWSEFLKDKNRPDKPIRLKTIRLRGQISQGLVVPLSIVHEHGYHVNEEFVEYQVGFDWTERLGIVKYEPPVPASYGGNILRARPSYVPKTDELRVQSFPSIIDEMQGKLVYFSTKVDDSSGTFSWFEGQADVCSRNWSIGEDDTNIFWRIAKKHSIIEKLELMKHFAIQGEVAGPGIQKNPLKLNELQFFAFNVLDIHGRRYLDCDEFLAFCRDLDIPTVPDIVTNLEFTWNLEELLELAKGTYAGTDNPREGIVIRTMEEQRSEALDGGRASFKVINNDFLLKGGD